MIAGEILDASKFSWNAADSKDELAADEDEDKDKDKNEYENAEEIGNWVVGLKDASNLDKETGLLLLFLCK